MPYYGVAVGRKVGVYNSWQECRKQTDGYSNAEYRRFDTAKEAYSFVLANCDEDSRNFGIYIHSDPDDFPDDDYSGPRYRTYDGRRLAPDGSVIAYTDGACSDNGKPWAVAGIGVFWAKNHPDNISMRLSGRGTNNRAEIQAVVAALEQAYQSGYEKVTIRTDSQFVVNAICKWIHRWEENGWCTVSGEPVKNRADFEDLLDAMRNLQKVSFQKVYGHAGIYGNEQADRLAREAIYDDY